MIPADILQLAEEVLDEAKAKGLKIATAESCTGGLVAGALTAIAGSSDVVDCGFVTYSNEAKSQMVGVDPALIAAHGAVSSQVAMAMAGGALKHSRADVSVAITGVAGPGGGSAEKPVGLVWFGSTRKGVAPTTVEARYGDIGREAVREESVRQALRLLLDEIRSRP
jgi:nicotinamide-nucleotide amidase